MARKNFKSSRSPVPLEDGAGLMVIDASLKPLQGTLVEFPENTSGLRRFDFSGFYGKSCDEVVYYCQKTIENMVSESRDTIQQTRSIGTIVGYCDGLNSFFHFCENRAFILGRNMTLKDIDKDCIKSYIHHLSRSDFKSVSQRNKYKHTKSVLMDLCERGLIEWGVFPRNPYPNVSRESNGQSALSKEERKSVMKTIGAELRRIEASRGPLSRRDLAICALGIAARTGLNPTPLLQLPVDCIQPHPLKRSRRLLVSFKRRGNATRIQSMRNSEDKEALQSVRATDVVGIIEAVKTRNEKIRKASKYPFSLFVYKSQRGGNAGEGRPLSKHNFRQTVVGLVTEHKLTDDDGAPLQLNIMRLRKTFDNRMYELSEGDPFVSAALSGKSVQVHANNYLEAPRDAEKNFRFMGEVFVESLLEDDKSNAEIKENTPVAGCSDNKYGDRAPKNGSHCVNFLKCFICKNFIVTADDLYRVYSFYWLLVRERERIGARRWSRYYAHVIRIVDKQIAPQFDAEVVASARDEARKNPHPFWREPQILGVNYDDQ